MAEKVKPKADSDGNCAACDYFSDEHVACAAPDDVECDAKPEPEKVKLKPTCPVCGHEVDEPITSDDLEEANADRFFQDAIDAEGADE